MEDTEDSEKSYENMRYFLTNSTNEEAWFFYYFKGRDTLASDVVFNLLSNENISTVQMFTMSGGFVHVDVLYKMFSRLEFDKDIATERIDRTICNSIKHGQYPQKTIHFSCSCANVT